MDARKHHRIIHISYGTSETARTNLASAWAANQEDVTDIPQIAEGGGTFMIEMPDQTGNPKDPYGNQLPGYQPCKITIRALGMKAFHDLHPKLEAGTEFYWRFVLANDARYHTDIRIPMYLRPCPGSNQFEACFQLPRNKMQ